MATKSQLIFSTILSLILVVPIVLAQLAIPHQFYGSVNFLNGPAPDGLIIEAKIDDVVVASTTTLNGRYGYNPILFFTTDPNDNRAGELISFFVSGIDTGETVVFDNGVHTKLDFLMNSSIGKIETNETLENESIVVTPETPTLVTVGDDLNITISSSTVTDAIIEKVQKLESDFFTGVYAVPAGKSTLNAFEIKITGEVNITVTIHYEDTGIDEDSVVPYKFVDGTWVEIPYIAKDTVANTITFIIQAETPYAIFGSSPTVSAPITGGGGGGGTGAAITPTITEEEEEVPEEVLTEEAEEGVPIEEAEEEGVGPIITPTGLAIGDYATPLNAGIILILLAGIFYRKRIFKLIK